VLVAAFVQVLFHPCDIVHYHALGPSLFSFLPRLAGKKTVVTVQGLDWHRKKWNRLAAWVLRLGERAAILLPDRTMVVSQSHYAKRFGAETIHVPNGTPLRERCGIKRIPDWGLEAREYILFLGRFLPEKNCNPLIEAYEHLNTRAQLVLAVGANLEGLSLALLEAMGAGLCVLASDIPENRELLDGAGFLFQPGNVVDLERMLRFLISDASARAWAGKHAQQRIRQYYL
jgi:glycosyltransferase involved in cell wall biosynthesis